MEERLISYVTGNLTKKQQFTIEMGLKLILFGISSTLLMFGGEKIKYGKKGIGKKDQILAD